jgi:hypothetical protein
MNTVLGGSLVYVTVDEKMVGVAGIGLAKHGSVNPVI